MEILLWLVPAGVATLLAMLWAAWAGRPARDVRPGRDRDEAAYERFAAAIDRDHPARGLPRPVAPRDRSTGVAVRRSRRPQAEPGGLVRLP